MRPALAVLLVLLALAAPRAAHAQSTAQLLAGVPSDPPLVVLVHQASGASRPVLVALDSVRVPRERATGWLVAGGVAGGGVGMFAGMIAGALIDGKADEDCIDFCFGPGLILGTLAGEALGGALGVHLANGRRGSLPLGMLTSAGILTLGLFTALEVPEILLVIPVAQLVGAIRIERATAPAR